MWAPVLLSAALLTAGGLASSASPSDNVDWSEAAAREYRSTLEGLGVDEPCNTWPFCDDDHHKRDLGWTNVDGEADKLSSIVDAVTAGTTTSAFASSSAWNRPTCTATRVVTVVKHIHLATPGFTDPHDKLVDSAHGHFRGDGDFKKMYPDVTRDNRGVVTKTLAHINGTDYPMTAATQKIRGQNFVADPLLKYKVYDPHDPVAPTGSCHGIPHKEEKKRHWVQYAHQESEHHQHLEHHAENEHHMSVTASPHMKRDDKEKSLVRAQSPPLLDEHQECSIERCMWSYMKPLEITTVHHVAMYDEHGDWVHPWVTHKTELRHPHWGTVHPHGLYYPLQHTLGIINGTSTHDVARQTPLSGLSDRDKARMVHKPKCWDVESCYAICSHANPSFHLTWWLVAAPIIGALMLLCPCCLCCLWMHRRRKRDSSKETIPEKIRRISTRNNKPDEVVVNTVTGTTTDPAGRAVDPSTAATTAVIAGTAAGATAAGERSGSGPEGGAGGGERGNPAGAEGSTTVTEGGDGKGTTGRRAEEGRGRVNFADAPGAEAHPEAEQHTQPVPVHDGAAETTSGRQMADVGSMRGRKRSRPEAAGALGLF